MSLEKPRDSLDFTSQFENMKEFELLDGIVKYIDIKPETLKTEIPVLFALGWGETIDVFRDSIRKMVSLGRRVICINHTRQGSHTDKEEIRKALAILKVLEENNISKVDVIAHSEGGINTAIACNMKVDRFRNVIFVNSGGLIGKDTFPRLMFRFSRSILKDYWHSLFAQEEIQTIFGSPKIDQHSRVIGTIKDTAKYIGKNPARALKESIEISRSEITDLLINLHKEGVNISIVNGEDDPVFPVDKMEKVLKQLKEEGCNINFIKVPGGHSEIFTDPEGSIPRLEKLLEQMEKFNQKTP